MEISELLDLAKKKANLPSDYALAKVIEIKAGNLSNIRKGRTHPSNEEAVQLATLAGLDEMQVIAEIEMRTAKNEKKRKFWENYIENKSITASISITALALSILISPNTSEAGILHLQNYGGLFEHNENLIYIMRISVIGKSERFRLLHLVVF